MAEPLLQVRRLTAGFGAGPVLFDVDLDFYAGELVALIGANGAGKTTTLSIIAGLAAADGGTVHVGGVSIESDPNGVKRQIGLVPQDLALYDEISARANLEVFGGLYGLSGATLDRAIDDALSLVCLADRSRELVRGYSGGMKRRLNIAGALLHDPEIILLDEPTVGVDPQSRNAIFDNLEALKARGKTIVYTTHYMEEAERLCERIVIIDHGRVLADDTLAGLQARVPSEGRLSIDVDPSAGPSVLRMLADAGVDVRGSTTRPASLESVFLTLTGRSLRDE